MKTLGRNFLLLTVVCLLLSSCGGGKPKESTYEIDGTEDQRIEAVRSIIQKHVASLPTPIIDPHFIEEQTGDGRLGPSDFKTFCVFRVPKERLDKWTSLLGDLESFNDPPSFVAPKEAKTWWVSSGRFSGLTFFSPRTLTGRSNGWIGIDPTSGDIFVYSFTM